MRKNQVIVMTPVLVQEIQEHGVSVVAGNYGWNRTTLSDSYHNYCRKVHAKMPLPPVIPLEEPEEEPLPKDELKSHRVLIIGDRHSPFTHKRYFDFCRQTRDEFQCDTIVDIGDGIDNHAINYHDHNPDGQSAGDELKKARDDHQKWFKEFPNVKACMGNHDELVYRKAMTHGLSTEYFKKFNQILKAPRGWIYNFSWEIDHVRYQHGTGGHGENLHKLLAAKNRQSTVIGHVHSHGGVAYLASSKDLIFGLNVGCGIDINAYAMNYGRDFAVRPTLGCGVVLNGRQAFFVPMDLGAKILWR